MKLKGIFSTLSLCLATLAISCTSLPLAEHIDYNAEWSVVIESLENPADRECLKHKKEPKIEDYVNVRTESSSTARRVFIL